MKKAVKPSVALTLGALFLSGALNGTLHAQSTLIESGTSYLVDLLGSSTTSPETLAVSWFVVENDSSGIYTYAYNVFNPPGDVVLNNNGTTTTSPEYFNSFTISFPTPPPSGPGSYFFQPTSPVGGSVDVNPDGITYTFPSVAPGDSSPLLAFQTTQAPIMVNASAGGGGVPPSPWSNVPDNSPVPAPGPRSVPEPGTAALLGLGGLAALRRFFRRG